MAVLPAPTLLPVIMRICTNTMFETHGASWSGLCCRTFGCQHTAVSIASSRRLESKGIEVLVERRIAREFPHYRVFDPCRNGEC